MDKTTEYPEYTGDILSVSEALPDYHPDKRYTFEEWLELDRRLLVELHDGKLVEMYPSIDGISWPSAKHQAILGEIYGQLRHFLKGKTCRPFLSPFGTRLSKKEDTELLPDILVICDRTKYENGKYCNGAPDMVVEILSPSTSRHDRVYKFDKYQKAGVPEYWIVDPKTDTVQANVLHNGLYVTHIYDKTKTVPLTALEGCQIVLPDVFEEW